MGPQPRVRLLVIDNPADAVAERRLPSPRPLTANCSTCQQFRHLWACVRRDERPVDQPEGHSGIARLTGIHRPACPPSIQRGASGRVASPLRIEGSALRRRHRSPTRGPAGDARHRRTVRRPRRPALGINGTPVACFHDVLPGATTVIPRPWAASRSRPSYVTRAVKGAVNAAV